MKSIQEYRLHCSALALLLLGIAFASKAYRGPWWHYANAYVGDIMIVGVIYFTLTLFAVSWSMPKKALCVFIYAVLVELFQATGIPASWNLPAPFVYVFGSVFSYIDILAYIVGLFLAGFLDNQIK
jgi:hypothetical protein